MITLPSYLTGFSSRADGSASIRFATQELSSSQFAELKENLNGFGYMLFSPAPIVDIPLEPIVEDKDKTPSKRLRSVLFLYWKQSHSEKDFETWYRINMEVFIESVKSKLE